MGSTRLNNNPSTTDMFSLPTPAQLKSLSYTPAGLVRNGREYLTSEGYPYQHVTQVTDRAQFTPSWDIQSPDPADLAYACYTFGLDDYDREYEINFSWTNSGEAANAWIGIADFAADRWAWYALPESNKLEVDFSSYLHPGDSQLLLVTLFTGSGTWGLEQVWIGEELPAGYTVDGYVYQEDGVTGLIDVIVQLTGDSSFQATTDNTGHWVIAGVKSGSYTVTPHTFGWSFTPPSREIVMAEADFTVDGFVGTIAPTFTVFGYTYAEDGTTAMFNVEMKITGDATWNVYTDATGRWETEVSNGEYNVRPFKIGQAFEPVSRDFTVTDAGLEVGSFLGAPSTSHTLDGYVYDEDGTTPLLDAEVHVGGDDWFYPVYTDIDGYWVLEGVYNGHYTVQPLFTGWGFTPQTREVVMAGADLTVDPFTGRELSIVNVDGYVFEADGTTPLVDVWVTVTDSIKITYSAFTDASGYWSTQDVYEGSYKVEPFLEGWTLDPLKREVAVGSEDLTVDPFYGTPIPQHTVDGYVYREGDNAPVADVDVQLWAEDWTWYNVETDATGHWVVEDVYESFCLVSVQKQGWTFDPVSKELMVDSDVTVDPFYGTSLPSYAVDGYVYLSDGITPAPDIDIEITGSYYFTTTTDETGHWLVSEAFDGNYNVTPTTPGWDFTPDSRTLAVEGAPVTVDPFTGEQLPTVAVDGYVYEEDGGAPLPDVTVHFSGEFYYQTTTDATGHWVQELPDGDWSAYPSSSCWMFEPWSHEFTVSGTPLTIDPFWGIPGG